MSGNSSEPILYQNVRWKEEYVSRGMNAKFSGVISPGIYKGFTLAPGGGMNVLIGGDLEGRSVAVVDRDGYSITVTMGGSGIVEIPAPGVWFVCLDAFYTPSSPGYQRIVMREEPEPYHVVLGKVVANAEDGEASITITQDMISYDGRREVGDVYAILNNLLSRIATPDQTGFVRPDGVTTAVDGDGVLSALGGALLYNREEVITASGTWTAKVTGWHELTIIAGGDGPVVDASKNFVKSGSAGSSRKIIQHLTRGQVIPVIVGSGGVGIIGEYSDLVYGGLSKFGEFEASRAIDDPSVTHWGKINFLQVQQAISSAIGPNANLDHSSASDDLTGHFPGGGGSLIFNINGVTRAGNGASGAVIIRYYDPAYAAGPVEAAPAAQSDVAQASAPVMARMSARRVGAALTAAPEEQELVNLYDPETGKGSVWRAEDVPAKLAGGMLSEDAWRERCAVKAAEAHAAWLADPATEAERFAMLRAARDAKLAATDYLMAPDYPLSEDARAQVAAYRQALRDLPEQDGAPWDGGGDATPWPVDEVKAGVKSD